MQQINARNVPGPLFFGASHSKGHPLFFVGVSSDSRHVLKVELKDINRGHWLRCKVCLVWCPGNDARGYTHKPECVPPTNNGAAWARMAAVQWAGAMALHECRVDGEQAMVHLMWHHFMALNNGMVPEANEWDELGPFLGRLRRAGDDVLAREVAKWETSMSCARKFNVTSVGYGIVARPLGAGPVDVDAPPVIDVVADGVEAEVLLPEVNEAILVPLVDDGLPSVELEVAADVVGGVDAEMVPILEDVLPVPDGEPAEMGCGEPALQPVIEVGADGNDPGVAMSEVDVAIQLALAEDFCPGELDALMDVAGGIPQLAVEVGVDGDDPSLGEPEALTDTVDGRAGEAREPPEG